jgi:hypothetical protein
MYNTKITCTYNTSDVFLETDNINDEEKDFIRDAVYRQELLNILGLEDYDIEQMDKAINELYEKVKNSSQIFECMLKAASNFMCEDKIFGLIVLYSFDYMWLTHICISEYLEKGIIDKANIDKLINKINLNV